MSEGENREGSEAISQQAPASNPGSDDPSGGIATGSGGVSSAAYVNSPVPSEQKSVVQTTVDTVKSYLSGLSLGGGTAEGQEKESTTGGESSSTGGYVAAASGAAAAAASYVGLTSSASTDSADPSASATAKDVDMTDSEPKDDVGKTDKTNETSKAAADSWAPGEKENTTGGSTTDTGNEEKKVAEESWTPDKKEATSGGDTSTSEPPKKTTGGTGAKENRDAIPTAGGERLGDKHWGESKQVPDNPKPQSDAQVSSEEGQPDKATKDNTAQNTGGAAPPSSSADDGGEEKTSIKDKIKDKLHIGSKDK